MQLAVAIICWIEVFKLQVVYEANLRSLSVENDKRAASERKFYGDIHAVKKICAEEKR